jgi:Zn-dependent protease
MSGNIYLQYLCTILAFIPAIVFHEVAHGFVAWKLGDPTAKSKGRLSLNPLKHIDIFGTVILPAFLMLTNLPVFGYAKPVPYNPMYFKDKRKGDFLVGIAGPLANFVLAIIGSALMFLMLRINSLVISNGFLYCVYYIFLPEFIIINLCLMFFNLIPIPPLDGSSIIALFIPERYLPKWYSIQAYAMPILIIVMVFLPYLTTFDPLTLYIRATAGNLANLLIP